MILHYITIALRNLERQKLSAFINVIGLSLGLACFILFLLYAVNEFSYDRFHVHGDRIYRVYDWWKFPERQGYASSSATPLGPAMKNDLADVQNFVRLLGGVDSPVMIDGSIHSARLLYADPQVLSVFTFPLIAGDVHGALREPSNIILTRSTALKFFGDVDVIGKQIEVRDGEHYVPFTVTGVAEDVPENSTIQFDMLGNLERILDTPMGRESSNSFTMTIGVSVYVQLRPNSNLMNEHHKLASFRRKYFPNEPADLKKEGLWDGQGPVPSGYGLQPLASVHTDTMIDRGASDPKKIWMLIGIAGGVLVIACINFIILSIARSSGRSKEVGVRKISGSRRNQLVFQFLSESMLLTFIAALLGTGAAQVLLPVFNDLSGSTMSFSFRQYPELAGFLVATVVFTGVLSGIYPALIISRFKPAEVLKNKMRFAGSNFFTRSLVTFQFTLSVGLVISMAVILQQLSFMRSKDLGFEKEHVVIVSSQGSGGYKQFKSMLESHTAIAGVTGSVMGLGHGGGQMGRAYDINGKRGTVIEYPVDTDFLNVMQMKVIAGRNFDPDLTSDSVTSIIVNEALVADALNTTPEKALGRQIYDARGDHPPMTIIGVIRDFHFEALTRSVRPQLFVRPAVFEPSSFMVRLRPGYPDALEVVHAAWKKVAPDLPFRYSFVDENFDAFYSAEERWAAILGWAGNLCIVLACLGLLGLASLAAANRTKEIGIRKVLGASSTGIASLLCREFVMMVALAIAIAFPITWYAMNQWLEQFAYRIELTWITFLLTGLLTLAIAVLTVASQAVNASLHDPVRLLRSE